MANKPNTICRVCGKEYYCCGDSRVINSWRTMACCEDHYKEYIRRIDLSRQQKINEDINYTEEKNTKNTNKKVFKTKLKSN